MIISMCGFVFSIQTPLTTNAAKSLSIIEYYME